MINLSGADSLVQHRYPIAIQIDERGLSSGGREHDRLPGTLNGGAVASSPSDVRRVELQPGDVAPGVEERSGLGADQPQRPVQAGLRDRSGHARGAPDVLIVHEVIEEAGGVSNASSSSSCSSAPMSATSSHIIVSSLIASLPEDSSERDAPGSNRQPPSGQSAAYLVVLARQAWLRHQGGPRITRARSRAGEG